MAVPRKIIRSCEWPDKSKPCMLRGCPFRIKSKTYYLCYKHSLPSTEQLVEIARHRAAQAKARIIQSQGSAR